jgi:hypothetical protein
MTGKSRARSVVPSKKSKSKEYWGYGTLIVGDDLLVTRPINLG